MINVRDVPSKEPFNILVSEELRNGTWPLSSAFK